MERKTYPSGMWSERDGSLLKWGKGDKSKVERFEAGSIFVDVLPVYQKMIRDAGQQPEQFCMVQSPGSHGGPIVARTLIPEVEACIAHAQAEKDAREKADRNRFEAALSSGEAFCTAEIADQYGGELAWARRFREEEKTEYADWFRDLGMTSFSGAPHIKVNREAIRQVVGSRKPDGKFCGCSNRAWTITEQEWDQIIALSAEMNVKKAEKEKAFEAAEAADIKKKIETGYCFYCESWCNGDCGHYTNDPAIMYPRQLDDAIEEQNYGIRDYGNSDMDCRENESIAR
jgi:hypothetical protein